MPFLPLLRFCWSFLKWTKTVPSYDEGNLSVRKKNAIASCIAEHKSYGSFQTECSLVLFSEVLVNLYSHIFDLLISRRISARKRMSIRAGLLKSLSAKTTSEGNFHVEVSMSVIGILLVILGRTRQFNLLV